MTDELTPDALAALRLVAENPFARPSERVAARRVLNAVRDAERAGARAAALERLGGDLDAPLK